MRLLHGLVGIAVGAEAIAILLELQLKERVNHLVDRLLQHAVGNGGNAQQAALAVALGYGYP